MTGTVIVSYSLGEKSSVDVPTNAPMPADRIGAAIVASLDELKTKAPTANETILLNSTDSLRLTE